MQITTDTNTSSGPYCGSVVPKMLFFDATSVVLTFVSDYSETRSGFRITYKVLSRKGYQFSINYPKTLSSLWSSVSIVIVVVITAIIILKTWYT